MCLAPLTSMRFRALSPGLLAICFAACSATVPPTTVPAPADATFEPFRAALQAYVDQTQPYRQQAADAAERVPGKAAAASTSEASVRTRETELATALRTRLRPSATQGEIFT